MIVRNFLALCLALPAMALALGPAEIRQAMDAFMADYRASFLSQQGDGVELDYRIGGLDNRLQLADCSQPLDVSPRDQGLGGRGQLMTKVSCADPAWSIYVPVDLQLRRPVVVTTQPIGRHSVITASQVTLRAADVSAINGQYFTDPQAVVGHEATRLIHQDAVVLANQLELPPLVRKGEAVLILAREGGLEVKTAGTALSDGRLGEQIRVENKTSGRVVEAVVTGAGETEVRL